MVRQVYTKSDGIHEYFKAIKRVKSACLTSIVLTDLHQVYDVKGIDMGNGLVRYKAEIDFDGRELARSYLERSRTYILIPLQIESDDYSMH